MLWCSFIVGWCGCSLLVRLTPDGPSATVPGPPRLEPIPLYPTRFCYDISLNYLWWEAPKLGWLNLLSWEVFLLPKLPPCFLEAPTCAELADPPVVFRFWFVQFMVLSVECYLLDFYYAELAPPSPPPDPDFECFWLYILETWEAPRMPSFPVWLNMLPDVPGAIYPEV